MTVRCTECGEELLGAVNRCWRCGQTIGAHRGERSSGGQADQPISTQPAEPILAEVVTRPAQIKDIPAGSPFGRTETGTWAHWRRTVGRDWTAATISSWLALVLAAYGWALLSFSSIISFSLAVLALLLAVFGLWGNQRRLTFLAMVLACVLLGWSGFRMFVELFTWHYGYAPFTLEQDAGPVLP